VIDAYRDTVVELDHYQTEYGNPVPHDIAREFGDQAAYALFAVDELSPIALQHLVTQAEVSLEQRAHHKRELNRELDSLQQCDSDLSEIETQFAECPPPSETPPETVNAIRDELGELASACEAIITRRQEMLHSRPNTAVRDAGDLALNEYLYRQQLSVTCPVLHDAVSLYERIQKSCNRCETRLQADEQTNQE